MECCGDGESALQLSTKSCCSYAVGSLPGTQPSLLDWGAPAGPPFQAARTAADSSGSRESVSPTEPPELQPPPPRIGGPPLFTLNAALLR